MILPHGELHGPGQTGILDPLAGSSDCPPYAEEPRQLIMPHLVSFPPLGEEPEFALRRDRWLLGWLLPAIGPNVANLCSMCLVLHLVARSEERRVGRERTWRVSAS